MTHASSYLVPSLCKCNGHHLVALRVGGHRALGSQVPHLPKSFADYKLLVPITSVKPRHVMPFIHNITVARALLCCLPVWLSWLSHLRSYNQTSQTQRY